MWILQPKKHVFVLNSAGTVRCANRFIKYKRLKMKSHIIDKKGDIKNVADQLFHAALYKKPEIVFELHSLGLLDKKNGEKALYHAAAYDAIDVAKALLECGVSPSCYIETNRALDEQSTPLGIAADRGSERVVELLLNKGVNVDDYTSVTSLQSNCTPLRQAIIHIGSGDIPNPKIVSMLLDHGADVHKINPRGLTCLAHHGDARELELLLKAGLDPNVDAEGEPLLSRCVSYGSSELAVVLVNYGANIFYVNERNQTYLHRTRDAILTQALIEKGLDVNALDGKGRTPVECCSNTKSVEMLVSAGASISKLSMHHHAVLSSIFLTKKLIDEKQANFSSFNNEGKTPLRKLAGSAGLDGYLKTLKYVLKHIQDLDVNQSSPFGGWTALHEAFSENQGFVNFYDNEIDDKNVAKSEYTQAIDLLIAHGAQPLKDKTGRTPLMCLTLNGFSSSYNSRVIERYYRFEAEFYGVDPEIYKKELFHLRNSGFQQVQTPGALGFVGCKTSVPKNDAMEEFWRKIEMAKNSVQQSNHLRV